MKAEFCKGFQSRSLQMVRRACHPVILTFIGNIGCCPTTFLYLSYQLPYLPRKEGRHNYILDLKIEPSPVIIFLFSTILHLFVLGLFVSIVATRRIIYIILQQPTSLIHDICFHRPPSIPHHGEHLR